jgi:hypothetical protein
MASAMITASIKGHWGKPIWAAKGGAELAVSFLASAVVAGAVGPGRLSLDALWGVRLPRWVTGLTLAGAAGLLAEVIRPTFVPRLANLLSPQAEAETAAGAPTAEQEEAVLRENPV